ncbi:MAG: DUF3098 domain-containing protein [Ginsengibacter sp.]|jgi:hypothetical protein
MSTTNKKTPIQTQRSVKEHATAKGQIIQNSSQGNNPLFTKDNYKWMLIGLVVLIIGFFLMAGGKSADPNVFNDNVIYGFQRITLAPILIIAGLVIEVYAIMRKQHV